MNHAHLLLPLAVFLFLACAYRPEMQRSTTTSAALAPPTPPTLPLSTGRDEQLTIPVGRDDTAANLAVWVLQPPAGTPIRGTVLFLHGFLANHRQVAPAGDSLRKAGFRSVLVDLRGFGDSTGQHITFGALDARDMSQLVDALQAKNLCGQTLGVYGTSYGAASAILFAGADPRVTTVVAVAPFASIREEVPSFGRSALGDFGSLIPNSGLNSIADAISRIASLDLDAAKPIEAIAKTNAQILLIHGDADTIIPHAASEQLHAVAPDHTQLKTMPGWGHLDLCFDIPGDLFPITRQWFEHWLH